MDANRATVRAVYAAAAAVMLLTCAPYLYGWRLQGRDASHGWYTGYAFGAVDNAVYASWLRSAADGAVTQRNLFTTRPQGALPVNAYYLLVGRLLGAARIPERAAFQLTRLALGVLVLRAVWWLIGLLVQEDRARWAAWLCVCFSSGLGWLWEALLGGARPRPTDLWQPEGFTFLSLYWSPHFLAPLLLMIGVVGWMIVAERRRSLRAAAAAGLCGLILADIHPYDLVPLALAWAAFLAARALPRRRLDAGAAGRAACAAAVAAPGALYMAWALRADPVLAARAAVLTISPPPLAYLVGYGATLGLAAWAAAALLRGRLRARDDDSALLLCCWAGASLAAAYLPVPFQRKLVMGAHLPIAILAGLAVSRLAGRRRGARAAAAVGLVVGLLGPSHALFLWRDARALRENLGPVRLYLLPGERASLAWIRAHAAPGDALQPLPWLEEPRPGEVGVADVSLALYAPGLTGLRVQCGHEGETPRFRDALFSWARFCLPTTPDRVREEWLRSTGVRWLIFSQKRPRDLDSPLLAVFRRPPPFLRRVPEASNADADVFEVALPPVSAAPTPARRAARGA